MTSRASHLGIFTLALAAACLAAAPKKKAAKAPAKAPAAVSVPAVATAPVRAVEDRPQIWHLWTDVEGRKVEAMFCGLSGDVVSLQTKDGRNYRFKTSILSPEDREFAKACAGKQTGGFTRAVVAAAAADIDRIVEARLNAAGQKLNAAATDEEFLRRIYVDAVGRTPTAEEAAAFLGDAAADRRERLIDRLLQSPGYSLQMYNWMADLLRAKDIIGKRIPAFTFEDWLKARITANATWDVMVREMISADGRILDNGAAGFLLFDADMPLDGVSNLITTFLGSNMSCAQCHDHPLADWSQRQFFEMAAFLGAADMKNESMFAEVRKLSRADSGLNKNFLRLIGEINALRIADSGQNKLTFPKDYKYDDAKPGEPVKPALIEWDSGDAKRSAYSVSTKSPAQLRDEFARWLTSPENPRFATNIANRVWKKNFGMAVKEPVDDIDDLSAASSPQLLAHLTQVMRAARFDLREFQRVVFNSRTYQSAASPAPDLSKGPYLFNGPIVRRLTAEQVWDSLVASAVGPSADNILLRRGEDLKPLALPEGKITVALVKDAATKMQGMRSTKKSAKISAGTDAGLANGYEGEKPQSRNGLLLARASELPQPAPETHFLRVFGQGDRLLSNSSTVDGSVPQVLQLMNGPVARLLTDPKSHAVQTAAKEKTSAEQVRSLYLAFLSRNPTAAEAASAQKALEGGLGLTDVAWTLANTREFLFIR
ncbi:MAG: DUF1549 domain-containing protein [Verrucomicrobiota bacterium]